MKHFSFVDNQQEALNLQYKNLLANGQLHIFMSGQLSNAFVHDLVEQLIFESSTCASDTICADSKKLVVVALKS